jgi:hypothetical protein
MNCHATWRHFPEYCTLHDCDFTSHKFDIITFGREVAVIADLMRTRMKCDQWWSMDRTKTKLFLSLINQAPGHEDAWGSEGIAVLFLTSALHGVERSASLPGRVAARKELLVPIGYETERSPLAVWTLWNIEKSLALIGNRTLAVQPVVLRCTDWGIPAREV